MGRRVVVTGIGCIAPCGVGRDALREAMEHPRSFIRRITRFDASPYPCRIGGEVEGFEPADFMDGAEAARLDRGTQFAMAAGREAVHDAGLKPERLDRARLGVTLGVAAGCMEWFERHADLRASGILDAFARSYYAGLASAAPAAAVARALGARGRVVGVSTGCTAGTEAIGYAFRQIRAGRADVMVAGGADAPIAPLTFSCFTVIGAMPTRYNDAPERASRPFDADRDGFLMSEGAGVVVLEDLDHALRRGARIYMEVSGYGTTLNAFDMVRPPDDGEGTARAIAIALQDAGAAPTDVECVSAHGSSTPINEPVETRAFKTVFGAHAPKLAVTAVKSMLGHGFGAAGGHQAAAAALTFAHDLIPPVVNLDAPDLEKGCDLDCVRGAPRRRRVRVLLQNSCGFSGKNAALLYRRYEPPAGGRAA